jgi:hypothetical protein
MKINVGYSSEMSVSAYKTLRCHNPWHHNLNNNSRENYRTKINTPKIKKVKNQSPLLRPQNL